MSISEASLSGLVGAAALTAIHEVARKNLPDAPRMDLLGMQAISQCMQGCGLQVPARETLREEALAGDLMANGLYYSLVACGRPETAVMRGAALGLFAGIGAVALPGKMNLDENASGRTVETKLMTVGWYVAGGIAAGLAYRLLASR